MNDIGKSITKIRKARNLSQQDLATALGITQTHLSQIESGKGNASQALLERVEYHFGIPLAVLMWAGIKEQHVAPEKREAFIVLKPAIDILIESFFFQV